MRNHFIFMTKYILIALLLWLSPTARADSPEPPTQCGNLLKDSGFHHDGIEYIECESIKSNVAFMNRLEATYRVPGDHIAAVEKWLIQIFRAEPLHYNCCGWETGEATFKGADGASYVIGMGGETTVAKREDFSTIPFLTLHVSHYLYSP